MGRSNRNHRTADRRRRRHLERVQRRHDEKLYEEARLDPNTVEGQGKATIDRIAPPLSTPEPQRSSIYRSCVIS